MGTLTHAEMVTEALELAGNTGLTTRAQKWLGMVLRRLNEKFTFPQTVSIKEIVEVDAGDDGFSVGRAASADAFASQQVNGIQRVLMCSEALNDWEDLTVEFIGNLSAQTASISSAVGRPQVAIIETDSASQANFEVSLVPPPDRPYRLIVIANAVGLEQAVYSASVVNPYPDDLTVVQGIYALALKHQQDERAASEWALFEDMEKKDRVRYGNMNHASSKIGLGGPHKRRNPGDTGGGWMGPV